MSRRILIPDGKRAVLVRRGRRLLAVIGRGDEIDLPADGDDDIVIEDIPALPQPDPEAAQERLQLQQVQKQIIEVVVAIADVLNRDHGLTLADLNLSPETETALVALVTKRRNK